MSTKREIVRNLLTGELDPQEQDIRDIAVDDPPPVSLLQLGEQALSAREPVLSSLEARIAELRQMLRTDPDRIVEAFRRLYDDDRLVQEDIEEMLDGVEFANRDPDTFFDLVTHHPALALESSPTFVQPAAFAGGVSTRALGWIDKVRAYLHLPRKATAAQKRKLKHLRTQYQHDAWLEGINPNERKFESLDPAWVPLFAVKIAEERGHWVDLAEFRQHTDYASGFVYKAKPMEDIRIGLFSDFGTGSAHSKAIARQLAEWAYPFVFHLGDVYYAGRQEEFRDHYERPLADVMERSLLFSLPENHELYSGGKYYLDFLDRMRKTKRIVQEGSYFCVRFDRHQVIGIDVNWKGRQRFLDKGNQRYRLERDWLDTQLREGRDLTTILLTGSAPYSYSGRPNRLYNHLEEFWSPSRAAGQGRVDLWFWGDDHHCALYWDENSFVGSCIGHAGFPGKKQAKEWQPAKGSVTRALWWEHEARFPAWTKMRQDVGNSGWCEATLRSDGGVDLLYVDWLSAKRCHVHLDRQGRRLAPRHKTVVAFDRPDEHGDASSILHRPG